MAGAKLVEEVRGALLDPRISSRYRMTPDEVDELCRRIQQESIWRLDPVQPPRTVPDDPGDDYLPALALESGAEALVTRDRHFDGVSVAGVRILWPGVILDQIEG